MVDSKQKRQDQLGRSLIVPHSPKRIISLVPSQTELLFDLGLDEEIVGITKFCIHPHHKVKDKPIVGGTKNFRFEVIAALQPDVIIGNKEENYREGLEQLTEQYPVWISDVKNLPQAQAMIAQVGQLVGQTEESNDLNAQITENFTTIRPLKREPRVAYLIWRDPYMVAGKDTFIHEMLRLCGFANPFSVAQESRYPEVTVERLKNTALDHIFLSSEPFPFQEKHRLEMQKICPNVPVTLVDGEPFSWYGSRLLKTPAYFKQLLEKLKK